MNPYKEGTLLFVEWEFDRHNKSVFGSRNDSYASLKRCTDALALFTKHAKERRDAILAQSLRLRTA